MRALAYIQTIKSLSPIPGADNIECATVLGWDIVVKRNDFKVGDLIILCEIDAILPDLPPFEFLRAKKFRIKTCKLRGCVSQGIVFPLSVINEVDPSFNLSNLNVGQDVTDVLQITKYDPEALLDPDLKPTKKSWIANKFSFYKWKLFGIKSVDKCDFPWDVPKTDEVRVQKMGSELSDREGQIVYISEKIEGASATFVYRKGGNWLSKLFGNDYNFQVCSRNRVTYNSRSGGDSHHYLVQLAGKYNMLAAFKKLNRNLAIQGESIGPKIQGNIYKLLETDFRVFLVWDLDAQEYLSLNEALDITEKLGLKFVPVISFNVPLINDIKYYVELSKGKSQVNTSTLREGIVVRTLKGDFSFKSINPDYLLKQG